ncbi:hypothetical protein ACIQ7Q_30315 [Streptomyces sp. NPDC096176]|uniref:hypothetical protein n=1 Tax=Streptomyces sp. NPDC096176 TaxID=3366079 RepID=UPI00381F5DEF
MAFIFDGGTLDARQAREMRPQDGELSKAVFVPLDEARELPRKRLRTRLDAAVRGLDGQGPVYLHDGGPVW